MKKMRGWPPTFQYLRTSYQVDVPTAYGVAQLTPVVCVRCNGIEFVVAPSSVSTFIAAARAITRAHHRCQFRPLDRDRGPVGEWEDRWEQSFRWIANQIDKAKGNP